MADLMNGTSTWAAGTVDSATTLHNGVDEKRAEHINGPAAAVVAIEGKLGSAASLIGTKADLATRLAVGIAASGRLTSAEAGDICISARSSKSGWVICDGAAHSRSTLSELFAAIGTAYGVGDGSTTFNVPNFQGRSPMGAGTGAGGGTSGTGAITGSDALTVLAVGGFRGAETHLLTAAESGLPAHTHTIATGASGGTGVIPANTANAVGESAATQLNSAAAASSAHNTVHPVLGVNFFIKI
jgi:microcystin-dependent protein